MNKKEKCRFEGSGYNAQQPCCVAMVQRWRTTSASYKLHASTKQRKSV